MTSMNTAPQSIDVLLRSLRLPTFVQQHEELARQAERENWSFNQYLRLLSEAEVADREVRRTERLLKLSGLPREKNLDTLQLKRLPTKVRRQVSSLCDGGFVDRAENILAFGLPGRGKTHLLCAIGHELIGLGHRVLFTPAYRLVQRLLVAKRELLLEQELRKLDRFAAVIIDDIGYIQQDRDEMEVLFTFLGQRYERRSVMISSNLVFSQWDRIFKDPMTTAAAIDRVVHHATILELHGNSVRGEEAQQRNTELKPMADTATETTKSKAKPKKASRKK